MKRIILTLAIALCALASTAQSGYWVFLADKQGTTFDPYTYFDAKAIDRYHQCGADLYDITNYPVSERYATEIDALATEEIGRSRWLNAIGIMATPEQADAIAKLPYVVGLQPLAGPMQAAAISSDAIAADNPTATPDTTVLTDQVIRMQGQLFRAKGIDGKGIRIAVFDGGFPKVDTHEAFSHLRQNHQILKTWNFPNRKENVYGWNSHGTMTLSCIAGRMYGRDLGLATGAEFLLARTEVEAEPFKEEVWWLQAVEWADRNGANIISSSLGYGKDRYYTRDMDGTSYVARAGNLAARKGILVCNSAGNEGTDRTWKTIITPADADSVLCIGGIENDLARYSHIDFASYGPSADGRQKPDVCAFAHTMAASPKNNTSYEFVYGTSFSCPLVAGFAACAWQASPGKTAMQMFDLLRRSADLYPYCDYAYGYGVPQASYFTNQHTAVAPTFRFERQSATRVSLIPLRPLTNVDIFYKDVDANGHITRYGQRTAAAFDTNFSLDFSGGHRLVVNCGGFTDEYTFESPSEPNGMWCEFASSDDNSAIAYSNHQMHITAKEAPKETHWQWDFYMQLGTTFNLSSNEMNSRYAITDRLGLRAIYQFTKAYGIGLGVEYGMQSYTFHHDQPSVLSDITGMTSRISDFSQVDKHELLFNEWTLELFQRVRFVPAGIFHKGFHWDLGVYGSYGYNSFTLRDGNTGGVASSITYTLSDITPLSEHTWNYGLTTRFTYDWIGLYVRYRLNNIGKEVEPGKVLLPRLEVGIQIVL